MMAWCWFFAAVVVLGKCGERKEKVMMSMKDENKVNIAVRSAPRDADMQPCK